MAVKGSNGSALEKMRKPYLERDQILDTSTMAKQDPYEIWKSWFDDASRVISEIGSPNEPNQMVLATSSKAGKPSVRYLLLKGYDETGFYFYTNYDSRKGKELDENPQATICMYWPEVHRMVNMEGHVTKVSPERSDAYFKSRPLDSQIGAAVSSQSSVLNSRSELETRRRELEARVLRGDTGGGGGGEIQRPDRWGGYRLAPDVYEFWQGQRDRLHDRLRFRRRPVGDADGDGRGEGDGWICERLAP